VSSAICNHFGDIAVEVVEDFGPKFVFLKKTIPYREIFKTVPKGFIATQIHVLCANFVKFGGQEVVEVVSCLLDKTRRPAFADRTAAPPISGGT